ncbi:MAG: 30S ribosomal protein S19e [Candidatus Aenigmarchaeota archaeon]|nr:30S ribosomal protein S19e [Candidatus Aenigmarchaeota archaeon]
MTMRDVPPQKLILKLSEELKKNENIKQPEWSRFVKTGVSTERPPSQEDWWFLRSAAILRKIYLNGPVGTQKLRTVFGGRRRRGHKPAHHRKAGGKIIRLILQQLESAGYIKKTEKPRKGRIITPKGQKLLSKMAKGLR